MKDLYELRYDYIYNQINDRFDIQGNILTTIICHAMDNNGVQEEIKKRYEKAVRPEAFSLLDKLARSKFYLVK